MSYNLQTVIRTLEEINSPDIDIQLGEWFEYQGIKFRITVDEYGPNPREYFDNLGVIYYAHRRYEVGDCDLRRNPEGYEHLKTDAVVIPVYMLDHGGITISTHPYGDPWDSGQVGFISATRAAIQEWFQVRRLTKGIREKAVNQLCEEIDQFDCYLRGDMYLIEAQDGTCDTVYGYHKIRHAIAQAFIGATL